MKVRHRNRTAFETEALAFLYRFDGRRAVSRYGADDLETQVIRDAVVGFDQGGGIRAASVTWWTYEAIVRIAMLRHKPVETIAQSVQVQVSALTGRPWP